MINVVLQPHREEVLYLTYSPRGIHGSHRYQYEALRGHMVSLFKRTLLTKLPSRKYTIIVSEGWRPSIYGSMLKRLGYTKIHVNITFGDFIKLAEHHPWTKGLVKDVCDAIDVFVANSTLTYERLLNILSIDGDRVFVSWPIIVEDKLFMLKNVKPSYNDNKLIICHMSRLRDEDGPGNLIRIYEKLKDELNGRVCMYIIGKPLEKRYLKLYNELIQYSKKDENFRVTGYLPYNMVCEIFKRCSFFIYPAYLKSFGLPVTEAMVSGLIPIVTVTTGARDFVYMVDEKLVVDSVDEMVKVLLELHTYKAKELKKLSEKARKVALGWSKENAKAYYIRRLRDVLKGVKM